LGGQFQGPLAVAPAAHPPRAGPVPDRQSLSAAAEVVEHLQ